MLLDGIMRFSANKSIIHNIKKIPNHIIVLFLFMEDNTLKTRQNYLMNHKNRIAILKNITDGFNPENLEKDTRELEHWIYVEQRIRTAMRNLVRIWLCKKYKKRILNDEDPCTLTKPVKRINIFDVKSRGIYQFEAISLKRQIESSLGYSEWAFPRPNEPKNPCTNIPFHEGQLIRIIQGIRKYNYGSWMMEAYLKSNFNLKDFYLNNITGLKLYAIKHFVKDLSPELIIMMDGFIDRQFYIHNYNTWFTLPIIKWAIRNKFNDVYVQYWIQLFYKSTCIKYKYNIMDDNNELLTDVWKLSLLLIHSNKILLEYMEEYIKKMNQSNEEFQDYEEYEEYNIDIII